MTEWFGPWWMEDVMKAIEYLEAGKNNVALMLLQDMIPNFDETEDEEDDE